MEIENGSNKDNLVQTQSIDPESVNSCSITSPDDRHSMLPTFETETGEKSQVSTQVGKGMCKLNPTATENITKIKYLKIKSSPESSSEHQRSFFKQIGDEDLTEGICSDTDHQLNETTLSEDEFNQTIKENNEKFSDVQSINLIGQTITTTLMEKIEANCPQLTCIYINGAEFTLRAWISLIYKIAPRLIHLSLDNLIITTESQKRVKDFTDLFQNCKLLEELKLILFADEPEFDSYCLTHLGKEFKYLFLKICTNVVNNSKIDPEYVPEIYSCNKVLDNLSKGEGRAVEYLRLESDESYVTAVAATRRMARLPKLRALNLSINLLNAPDQNSLDEYYSETANLESIESLTLKFSLDDYNTDCNDMLVYFSNAKFKSTIKRFRIMNAELQWRAMKQIFANYSHLESIQLIDCVFDTITDKVYTYKMIVQELSYLTELIIEYDQDSSDIQNTNFIYVNYTFIWYIMRYAGHLKYIRLVRIPRITKYVREWIETKAESKGIKLCLG